MLDAEDQMDPPLIPGRATAAGTRGYAERFPDRPGHFRAPDRLTLSSVALGTRNGNPGGVDDLLYRSAVLQLLEGGVNVFATALSDRSQTSERCLGGSLARAIRDGIAQREEMVVISKGGYLTVDPDALANHDRPRRYLQETYVDTGLVDPKRIAHGVHCMDGPFLTDQIQLSRRNLGLETIDIYLLEEPDLHLAECGPDEFRIRLQGAFEALEAAVAAGSIGAYGVATWEGLLKPHTERGHLAILDLFDWALEVGGGDHHLRAVQVPYGLAMGGAFRIDTQIGPYGRTEAVLSALRDTGTAVLASAPLMQGRALGKLPGFVAEAFPTLESDAQRCLQFARSTPGITTAVVGMRDPDHVDDNVAVSKTAPASPEAIERLFKRAAPGGS